MVIITTTIMKNPSLKESKTIEVISKILSKNDEEAKHNRAHFNEANTLCINLMSSQVVEKPRF